MFGVNEQFKTEERNMSQVEMEKVTSEEAEAIKLPISIKTISSIVGAIVAILGSIWALDNHYASAADVEKMDRSFSTQINQLRQEKVEDELFALDVKKQSQNGRLSPVDQAMYERYKRRLQETMKDTDVSKSEK